MRKPTTMIGLSAVALVAGSAVLLTSISGTPASASPAGSNSGPVVVDVNVGSGGDLVGHQDFPVNKNGQTYGSNMNVVNPDDGPDLVLAYGTDGKLGYISATDLVPKVNSPEEALAYQAAVEKAGGATIPLYDSEGNIIGEFHMDAGETTQRQGFDRSFTSRYLVKVGFDRGQHCNANGVYQQESDQGWNDCFG